MVSLMKDVGVWNFTIILIGYFEINWVKKIRRKEGKPNEIPQPGDKLVFCIKVTNPFSVSMIFSRNEIS